MSRAALLLAVATAVSAEVPSYVCRRAEAPPVLDGRPDEAAWSRAEPAPAVYETGLSGAAVPGLELRFLHDAGTLYVAARIALPGGRAPLAGQREHDGKLWFDDNLELFLKPEPDSDVVLHLVVTAGGATGDFREDANADPEDAGRWAPAWQAKVAAGDGGWSLEAALPLAGLAARPPGRGHVWSVKAGVVRRGAPNAMWPRNTEGSFHNARAFGALIFEDPNLLRNGDFEAAVADPLRAPGWAFSYHEKEGKGQIKVVPGGRPPGRQMADHHKFDNVDWFPQLWSDQVPIQPGSTYRATAWVRCDKPFVFRHTFFGPASAKKHHLPCEPAPQWRPVSYELTAPPEFDKLALGFMLSRQEGHLYVDDVSLVRVNDAGTAAASLPDPDPIHHLVELARRRRFKPYDQLRSDDGGYATDRVIFRDSATGATIVKATRSGGTSTRHLYMEMSPWSCDGRWLLLHTGQASKASWIGSADGSSWRFLPWYASSFQWDRLDPTLIYYREWISTNRWRLARRHLGDAEPERLKDFDGEPSIWPMHPDGQKLLIQETFGAEKPPRSVIWVMDRNGRDFTALHPPHQVHQTWFTKLPDYSVEYEYEGQQPRGQYRITLDDRVHKICDETFGHRAHSPDGQWIAAIGRARLVRIDGQETRLLADVGTGHHTWETSNDWYCASCDPHLVRVSVTDRFGYQRLGSHNSAIKHSTYWSEAHPEMSPDGTKLGYASNMLHDIEFYWLVMRLPDTPRQLTARRDGAAVTLAWQPPAQAKELRGYRVYRSRTSGRRGELVTPEPITEVRLTDRPGDGAWHYSVTAVEHSGLESLLSNEATVGADPAARVMVAEAESLDVAPPAEEAFEVAAAGLYAVRLGTVRDAGPLGWRPGGVPAGARSLWARAKAPLGRDGRPLPFELTLAAGGATVQARGAKPGWLWLGGAVELPAGIAMIELRSSRPGVLIDQVVLAPAGYTPPSGAARADDTAPATPSQVSGEAVGHHAARLRWQPVPADLDHYNVYAASDGEVSADQPHLVASPATAACLDWGLEAGRDYRYLITAVDAAGNESAPSRVVTVATPPIAERLFTEAKLTLSPDAPKAEVMVEPVAATEAVIWLRAASLTGERRGYRVRLLLDGQPPRDHSLRFDYVSVGHGGPVIGVKLWDPVTEPAKSPADPHGLKLPAGRHTLSLELLDGAPMTIDQVVITNDQGYLPPGRCDFLVRPVVAEPE